MSDDLTSIDPDTRDAMDLVLVWRSTLIDDQCHWTPGHLWTPEGYAALLAGAAAQLAQLPDGGHLEISGDIEQGSLRLTDATGVERWWAKWILCDHSTFTDALDRNGCETA